MERNGVKLTNLRVNYKKTRTRRNTVTGKLCTGVDYVNGTGKITEKPGWNDPVNG
jgi:hypothetical protein